MKVGPGHLQVSAVVKDFFAGKIYLDFKRLYSCFFMFI